MHAADADANDPGRSNHRPRRMIAGTKPPLTLAVSTAKCATPVAAPPYHRGTGVCRARNQFRNVKKQGFTQRNERRSPSAGSAVGPSFLTLHRRAPALPRGTPGRRKMPASRRGRTSMRPGGSVHRRRVGDEARGAGKSCMGEVTWASERHPGPRRVPCCVCSWGVIAGSSWCRPA
jgi:hypothetical protein